MNPIYPIVKPVQPKKSVYFNYIESALNRNYLTNNGPLLQELESKMAEFLGVEHLMLVANGTLALHLAYRALGLQVKVSTTPFSFAATASSLKWEGMTPHFVDIDKRSFNIDHKLLPSNNNAIVAVHCFGNPCNVEQIELHAAKNSQPVIYDAAHAFASKYKGQSVLNYGDASTLSLHATKLFHCVEGGAIVFRKKAHLETAKQLTNFGFNGQGYPELVGINAKMSEVHAAMGLSLMDMVDDIVYHRKELVFHYLRELKGIVKFQAWHEHGENNGAYMPIILQSEQELLKVMSYLSKKGIQTRRYFYPSLSQVSIYGGEGSTPIANDISQRILCLPLYFDLSLKDVETIAAEVKAALLSDNTLC